MGGRDGFLGVKCHCMARAIFRRASLQYPQFRTGLFPQSSILENTKNPHLPGKKESHFLVVEIYNEAKRRWKKKDSADKDDASE